MPLLRSIATVGGFTLLSRILGFLRDILIAWVLGAGGVADAFFVAFKLPNLFRRLFAEGAFNAAFVPQFAGLHEAEGGDQARLFAERALAVLLWFLLVFVILFEMAMPLVMRGFAPGFVDDPEQFARTVELTRITFPYLLLISLVSLMAGVLNSLDRFAAAAATPILLNLSLIGAVLWLTPYVATAGHALAWGVAVAGIAQFLWLLIACVRAGMPLALRLPRLTPAVRTMLVRVLPGAIGAGVYQINLVIDMVIASLLATGSISYLFFADRINQLPLGVVGVAVGTALLPRISRQLRAGDETGAHQSQNRALEFSMFLTLPAALALIAIPVPIVSTLFERGAFGPEATAATAPALAIYAAGLPAYVLIKGLTPGFFARQDTVMPVKIAAVALVVNLVLNLALMGPLQHLGIATATALSAWLNAGTLAWVLRRRGHLRLDDRFKSRVGRALAASVVMALALGAAAIAVAPWIDAGGFLRITGLVGLVIGGLLLYGGLALLFRAATVDDLRRIVSRRAA